MGNGTGWLPVRFTNSNALSIPRYAELLLGDVAR